MREIKLRIRLRNRDTSEMITLFNPIFDTGIGVAFWQINNTIFEVISADEYTGLKDKNGKEIYEGDIVQSDAWNPKTYQVLFEDGSFGFKNTGDDYLNSLHYLEKFEVIGNIHEHPQLMETK